MGLGMRGTCTLSPWAKISSFSCSFQKSWSNTRLAQWQIKDFPNYGGINLQGGSANLLFDQNFPKKLCENERNWTQREPLLLRSTNVASPLSPQRSVPPGKSLICHCIAPKIRKISTVYRVWAALLQIMSQNCHLPKEFNWFFTEIMHR